LYHTLQFQTRGLRDISAHLQAAQDVRSRIMGAVEVNPMAVRANARDATTLPIRTGEPYDIDQSSMLSDNEELVQQCDR
jgi:hypothetical protein